MNMVEASVIPLVIFGIIDDHFQSIGFDVKMEDIEDNDVDWEKL